MLLDSPFHAGELAVQARAGVAARGAGIRSFMPDQHRIFFGQLPWLFAGVLDQSGWPLATALSGPIGFAASPDPTSLAIAALPQPDEPAFDAIQPGCPIGLLGLEFETRRRNRANGQIETVDDKGVTVSVAQSFGNCAKYIQARTRLPDGGEQPQAVQTLARLDGAAQALIAASDTLFIASAAVAGTPGGGVDVSHRGGRPGFIRIDGDTLTVPDFIGNNYFNTLGNLLEEPRAAILLVDFETGTMLQLQGLVEIIWDGPELAGLEGAQRLWRFHVTRGWRSAHALPLRWTAPDYAPTTLQTGIWAGSRGGRGGLEQPATDRNGEAGADQHDLTLSVGDAER